MEVEHYAIDAAMSRVIVRPFASAAATAAPNPTLTVREMAGEARFLPGTLDRACVEIRFRTASLAVTEGIGEEERRQIERTMHGEILEAHKYPEIVFSTSKVSASKAGNGQYWINLLAEISLHGVTASEAVAAQVVVAGDTLFARGELVLLPSTYKIKPAALARGTLRLRDEMKCLFDIVARKQPEHPEESNRRILTVEGS